MAAWIMCEATARPLRMPPKPLSDNPLNSYMNFKAPDYHSHEEFQLRSQKLEDLRNLGIDPYPHTFSPQQSAQDLHQQYGSQSIGHSEDAAAGSTPSAVIAGRLVLF